MINQSPSYSGYRFPAEIISYSVWLYYRFSLSFRDIEDLLAQRGVEVSYETIRQWCEKFGREYASRVRRKQPRRGFVTNLELDEFGSGPAEVLRGSACRFVPEAKCFLSTIAMVGGVAKMSSGVEGVVSRCM
jgi:hypothetical protein